MKKKKEILIKIYFVFSLLSFLVGLFLISYFLWMLKDYYFLRDFGFIKVPRTWQEVDFIGGLYSALWIITGSVLLFLGLKMQIKDLRFQLQEINDREKKFSYEIFEQDFTILSKNLVVFTNSIGYEVESFHKESESFQLKKLNSQDFFNLVNSQVKIWTDVLSSEEFPVQYEQQVQKYDISKTAINIKKSGLKSMPEMRNAAFEIVFKRFHYYLYRYTKILEDILSLINTAYDSEMKFAIENKELKAKYQKHIDFIKAHLSDQEMDFLRNYKEFSDKWKENISKFNF